MMKKILVLLVGILIISCSQSERKNQKTDVETTTVMEKSENFDWLLGKWKRSNEEKGKETFENWEKISETEYLGIGFTMQNGDTIKQEGIWLNKINGKWDLRVKVSQESEPITFNGISYHENEFTCINHELDFPNEIKYWKNGDKINATVSGEGMILSFEFERLKN
ncbi:MAG: hypothetical protein KAH25_06405 [Bacteroidales bacterium]|nr:hypothetical protein [Bacteroidales bacterium]